MMLKKRATLTVAMLAIAYCGLGSLAHEGTDKDKEKKEAKKDEKKVRKPTFTVGKETTFVVGPLDKTGRIDYETALNERLRAGVTPENNANVLLFKTFGPHPDGAKLPAAFFEWMKVPAPPEKGDYFLAAYQFAREHFKGGCRAH
jgi:hypothetical protein